jgi:polyferredoxin
VSTVDIIKFFILGTGLVFGTIALLGMVFYHKRILKLDKIRTSSEVFLVVLLNFTVLGNIYVSPFLPILRLDFPRLMARGALKACPLAIIQRVLTSSWAMVYLFAALAIIMIVGLVIGRGLCAWACPIGLSQDLINKLRNLFRLNPVEPPQKVHNKLTSIRFALLFFFLIFSLSIGIAATWDSTAGVLYNSYMPLGTTQVAPFCAYCPTPTTYYILTVFLGMGFHFEDPVHYVMWPIFIGLVLGAFLMPRFYCRYLCPVGAMSSLFNKVSLLHIYKENDKCTKCNVCYSNCPMRVEIVQDEDIKTRVNDVNCTFCGECVERCYERALTLKVGPVTIYKGGKSWAETMEDSIELQKATLKDDEKRP